MGQGSDSVPDLDGGYHWDCLQDNAMNGRWEGQDGTLYNIRDMTTSHIQNVIKHLQNRRGSHIDTCTEDFYEEYIDIFYDELDSRGKDLYSKSGGESRSTGGNSKKVELFKRRYEEAKNAPIGSQIVCPTCGNKHKKTTYHKIFDSNGKTKKGKGNNCKDEYWNTVDPKRRARAKEYKRR